MPEVIIIMVALTLYLYFLVARNNKEAVNTLRPINCWLVGNKLYSSLVAADLSVES